MPAKSSGAWKRGPLTVARTMAGDAPSIGSGRGDWALPGASPATTDEASRPRARIGGLMGGKMGDRVQYSAGPHRNPILPRSTGSYQPLIPSAHPAPRNSHRPPAQVASSRGANHPAEASLMRDLPLSRRDFIALSAAGFVAGAAGAEAPVAPKIEGETAWYDVTQWGVEGKGWNDTARFFDRLPARAEGKVRADVWNLSRHSAGMLVRFETDSPTIRARYRLLNAGLAMPHMPATGVSGLDLYARDERGRDRWLGVAQPHEQHVEATLAGEVDPHPGRRYTLYL